MSMSGGGGEEFGNRLKPQLETLLDFIPICLLAFLIIRKKELYSVMQTICPVPMDSRPTCESKRERDASSK